MIRHKTGDIFTSTATGFVNPVNCVGVMGAGLAKEFKIRYPEMFVQYKKDCSDGKYKPGRVYEWKYGMGKRFSIINFTTKKHWRDPSLYEYIVEGLDDFERKNFKWGLTSIAFPLLGSGCGGLNEDTVFNIMLEKLRPLPITIEIWVQ